MQPLNQTRISIDRVKIVKAMSEETLCFTARVLFDGNAFADARNHGRGGQTEIQPIYTLKRGAPDNTALAINRRNLARAVEFCATLPPMEFRLGGADAPITKSPWNLDDVVDHLACEWDFNKRVRSRFDRLMRSHILFEHDGAIYQIKRGKDWGALNVIATERGILKRRPNARILHLVPTDTAFAIYRQICAKD